MNAVDFVPAHRTVFGFLVSCVLGALLAYGCGRLSQDELRVVAWVKKNGIKIDRYLYGELWDPSVPMEVWLAEGKRIPNCEEVILRLLRRNDPRVDRVLLVQALCYVGTKRSVPELTECVRDDWDVVRHYALYALAMIADPGTFGTFVNRLFYDESVSCQAQAALGLAALGDPRGIKFLEERAALARCCEEHISDGVYRENCASVRKFVEKYLAELREKVSAAK